MNYIDKILDQEIENMPNLDAPFALAQKDEKFLSKTINFKPIIEGSKFEKSLLDFPMQNLREKYKRELEDWSSPDTIKHQSLEKTTFDIPRW